MSADEFNPIEERVRSYLRSRADVPVPRHLLKTTMLRQHQELESPRVRRFSAGVGLASAATLLVVVALAFGAFSNPALPGPAGSSIPSAAAIGSPVASPADSPTATSGTTPPWAAFPARVLGMPVISIPDALQLLHDGRLNGRAVAVWGYWNAFYPPCAGPIRPMGVLEDFCHFVAFADEDLHDIACCSFPLAGTPYLSPFLVEETSGGEELAPDGSKPVVLIGHAGDARMWFCSPENRDDCGRAFVVDRVAWARGHELPVELSGWRDTPRELTADDLAAILPPDSQMLSAVVVPAGDAATVDPRLRLAGDSSVWVVHAIGPQAAASDSEPTKSVEVYLIDDATRQLLSTTNLKPDAAYQPARLSVDVRVSGWNYRGQFDASYSVTSEDGANFERPIGFSIRHARPWLTFGPDDPDILEAGTYVISVSVTGSTNPGLEACSTELALNALDDVALEASFARDGTCTWGPPVQTFPY